MCSRKARARLLAQGTSMTTLPIATPTPILFIPLSAVSYPIVTWENPASPSRPRSNDTSSVKPSMKLGLLFGKYILPSASTVGGVYLQPLWPMRCLETRLEQSLNMGLVAEHALCLGCCHCCGHSLSLHCPVGPKE